MKKKTFFTVPAIFLAAFILLVSGCFSPWQGDEAVITLYFGQTSNRAPVEDDSGDDVVKSKLSKNLEHKIQLTGPSGVKTFEYGKNQFTAEIKVISGRYDIKVQGYADPAVLKEAGLDPAGLGELFETENGKYVVARGGSGSVNIVARKNNPVPIKMEWLVPDDSGDSGDSEEPDTAPVIGIVFKGFEDEEINLSDERENDISIIRGGRLIVTVNGQYDSCVWYIDGNENEENIDEYTFDLPANELAEGVHTLTAVVTKNGVPYSKVLAFTVVW